MQSSVDCLGNLAAIAAGHPLRGAIDELPAGEVCALQMRNVDASAGINWSEATRVTLPPARSTNYLSPGQVIFTTRGTRNFALTVEEVPGPAVCSPHFFVLSVLRDAITPEFLAWQINQRPAQEYLQREATGSYILNIRRDVMENLPIALPSLEQQRAIVALAEAAKAEREALTQLIDNRNRQMEAIALGLHHSEQIRPERPQA